MIHLDTSFLIRALLTNSPEDRQLRRWIREGVPLAMSAGAWTEFLGGPLSAPDLELASVLVSHRREFTPDHAATAARLFNASGRRRGSLVDCMIAAAALFDDAAIATANPDHFRRFEDSGVTLA